MFSFLEVDGRTVEVERAVGSDAVNPTVIVENVATDTVGSRSLVARSLQNVAVGQVDERVNAVSLEDLGILPTKLDPKLLTPIRRFDVIIPTFVVCHPKFIESIDILFESLQNRGFNLCHV